VSTAPGGLAQRARAFGAELAAAVAEGDELRRLPDSTWKLLLEGGFLRALQPARWGGGEVELVDFLDAVFEVSRANPSAGWVAGVIGVHPWQLALFEDDAQRELWGEDPTTMHSSSYNPTGTAVAVDGGYEVSGRWSFSSGCDHCRAVNLGAVVRDQRGAGDLADFRSFLVLEGDYRIDDTWHVAGLRGTGSKDIVVEGVFVPTHRTQSHTEYAMAHSLPGQVRNDGPLYRLPWSVVFNMAVAASVFGAAQGFVETWIAEARDRVIGRRVRLADDPLTQRRVAEAAWTLDTALTMLRADAVELTRRAQAGDVATMTERGAYRWHLNRNCEQVGIVTAELMRAASGRSLFSDHPLQRRYQDIQAGLGHAFLGPDPVARAVGGALLGTSTPELIL
jgi:3-hydroxy-9,10-secoandrosta-1,3,5(10)-triene-9,17-dione monooxygenase